MKTFYKYTSNFGADFFKQPKLKISNPSYLNDPFESEPGDNLIHVIEEGLKKRGADFTSLETREMTKQMLKSNGIFSVSETPRNPLMWAHYAQEHRGMCIGYSKDIFCNSIKPNDTTSAVAEYQPKKVNYDNYRFDRQKNIYSREDFIESIKSFLLTKSDEWIYEKEHRCIIPFSCATSFSVNINSESFASSFDNEMTIDIYLKGSIKKGTFKKIGENEYQFTAKTKEEHYISLSSFGAISFLYEIDPKHIHSIHMGFRFPDKDLIDIYEMVNKEGSSLPHVKLYRFTLSSKRFELLPEVIDEKYILNIKKLTKNKKTVSAEASYSLST